MSQPLEGIKVLELGNLIAGPFCTMLLGDMGADVIKIERPMKGDISRAMAPLVNGESASFAALNRNKRSLVLDLKQQQARDIAVSLVRQSDVFVENNRPGALEGIGLGPEQVRAINPSTDILGALFAAYAALSGLIGVLRDRGGQIADISLAESSIAAAAWETATYLTTGEVPQRLGHQHRLTAPYQLFETRDGRYIAVGAPNDELFRRLMRVLGLESHLTDGRFATNVLRKQNETELLRIVSPAIRVKDAGELERLLAEAGVPCSRVNDYGEVFDHPHIRARNVAVNVEHPRMGTTRAVRNPVLFAHDGPAVRRPAPVLGEHTRDILRELGHTDAQIENLAAAGAVLLGI